MATTVNLCKCGCGKAAGVYASNGRYRKKGQPKSFIHGHNALGRPIVKTIAERFWSKVDTNGPILLSELGPCWVWTGAKSGGYGVFTISSLNKRAHRVSWFLETGKWPFPCTLHKCDNPACVRYSHLFEGTDKSNADDKASKGRCNSPVGKNNGRSKLTLGNAKEIHRLLRQGVRQSTLALKYGVHKKTIWQIKVGITWVEAGQ
jgi:hypothetical protein